MASVLLEQLVVVGRTLGALEGSALARVAHEQGRFFSANLERIKALSDA